MFAALVSFLVVAVAVFTGPRTAFQNDNLPDIPANHWVYEMLFKAEKLGLLPEEKRGLFSARNRFPSGQPYNRSELAVFGYDITKHLDHEAGTKTFDSGNRANGVAASMKKEEALASICQPLSRFDLELAKEYVALGVNPHTLARKAKSLEKQLHRVIRTYKQKTKH
jgi:hypothetical protein